MADEEKVEKVESTETETEEVHEEQHEPRDFQQQARRWERNAKTAFKERDEYRQQLKDYEERDKSEHEKAVEAARHEGEQTARQEAERARRTDRLESETVKAAVKGFRLTGDDGKEQVLKFADPDDAYTYLERAIRRGDVTEDELFNDKGKVDSKELGTILQDILKEKPHLSGTSSAPVNRVEGTADQGRGSERISKRKGEGSFEDEFNRITRNKYASRYVSG